MAVSHDTIIAAIVAVISGNNQIQKADWPAMMEGLFVWFEGDEFPNCKLKWIWRGKTYELDVSEFHKVQ